MTTAKYHLFLDIDGVLNTYDRPDSEEKLFLGSRVPGVWEPTERQLYYIHTKKAELLRGFVKRHGILLILSSSWRWDLDLRRGLQWYFVQDLPPTRCLLQGPSDHRRDEMRPREIYRYVADHALLNWASLDDIEMAGPRHVTTCPSGGLTLEDLDKVALVLGIRQHA
jgi:hypothetical protein